MYRYDMHIIARPVLLEFAGRFPDSRGPLERWWHICRKNDFGSFDKLRKTFGSVDIVGKCVVFNIGGNKFRLVARINFLGRRMWIKYILPHDEYDRLDLREDPKCQP